MSGSPTQGFVKPTDEQWLAFAVNHPDVHVFHNPRWVQLLADCYGYQPFVVVSRDADNQICAGLPMMEVNSPLTGRRWVSLPFTDQCMPLAHDSVALNWLTHRLTIAVREQSVPRINAHCPLPAHPLIHASHDFVHHAIVLEPDSAKVQKRFHSMHRRNIKTAEKRGVHVAWGTGIEHMRHFYRLHLETRQRQGTPIQPWRFFEMLHKALTHGAGFLLLAYKDDDTCLAAALFLHWQKTLLYKYGASSKESMPLRPNNLIFWTAIRWACENGFTTFDMGRTDLWNEGLRDFKGKWGAEEQPLIYSMIAPTPPASQDGKLMTLVRSVIQKSPPWVCRVIGELLYRHVA